MQAPDDPALQRYLDVLRLIVQRLAGSDVVWAVTGSLGCTERAQMLRAWLATHADEGSET